MRSVWDPVRERLGRARDEGRTYRFWLRDDDAVAVTEPLEHLRGLCAEAGMPVLLAVIPAQAEAELGAWIDRHSAFTPCQHGFGHINHAPAGERACELGAHRPRAEVLGELAHGRARLKGLFGARLNGILVPPWNRIDRSLLPFLPGLGFTALSTFGPAPAGGICRLNCDLDIIDWRNGRIGRSLDNLCAKLSALLDRNLDARRPIGILTHHLAHDDRAWGSLREILDGLARDPAAEFVSVDSLRTDPFGDL